MKTDFRGRTRYYYLIGVLLLLGSCQKPEGTITPTPTAESIHLSLGNPTQAKADTTVADNYLMLKDEYALSYNRTKRHANWVSWELSEEWLGASDRQNNFRPDPEVPAGWYKVLTSDYTNTGFDRGHLCPSADRTRTEENNAATFLMTNIIPQAPQLNREAWAQLEEFCRSLAQKRYRLFIVAGTYGTGGEGSSGMATAIKNNVNVPSHNYKVIVAVPNRGTIEQIDSNTPIIAVNMANRQSLVNDRKWADFITTPEAIEKLTGTTFFTNLPQEVRNRLKGVKFDPAASPLRQAFSEIEIEAYF